MYIQGEIQLKSARNYLTSLSLKIFGQLFKLSEKVLTTTSHVKISDTYGKLLIFCTMNKYNS